MKLSELILYACEMQVTYGDLDVFVATEPPGDFEICMEASVMTVLSDEFDAPYFVLSDYEVGGKVGNK